MTEIANKTDIDLADEADLRKTAELLFFAYRDFISDPDAILARIGFGRAHHRAIHFIGRNPGMTVAELLHILQITKQSLARVLRQLVEAGYVVQRPGESDRRQRLLTLTPKGRDLEAALSLPQKARITEAINTVGAEAAASALEFLAALIDEDQREEILNRIRTSNARLGNVDRT